MAGILTFCSLQLRKSTRKLVMCFNTNLDAAQWRAAIFAACAAAAANSAAAATTPALHSHRVASAAKSSPLKEFTFRSYVSTMNESEQHRLLLLFLVAVAAAAAALCSLSELRSVLNAL
jgi:hypothetical protein